MAGEDEDDQISIFLTGVAISLHLVDCSIVRIDG